MRETRPGFRPGFGEAALRIRRRWFWPTYRSKTVATGQPADLAVQPFPDGRILVSGTIAADAGQQVRVADIPDPSAFARTALIERWPVAGSR